MHYLRNRFGIPGVISVVALVFAMFGGAYAASKSSEGSKATASAKSKRGPRGPKGPKGDIGPAGPKGDTGAAGAAGANGKDGAAGPQGPAGQSVTGAPIAAGGACGAGVTGVKYTLGATSTNVCNGKEGAAGQTGFTETLPTGKTETGTWAVGPSNLPKSVALPFNIPLSEPPEDIHYVNIQGKELSSSLPYQYGTAVNCLGSPEEPTAPAGTVCLYGINEGPQPSEFEPELAPPTFYRPGAPGAKAALTSFGAVAYFVGLSEGAFAYGVYAVTAK